LMSQLIFLGVTRLIYAYLAYETRVASEIDSKAFSPAADPAGVASPGL
jgi:hypothetical protein